MSTQEKLVALELLARWTAREQEMRATIPDPEEPLLTITVNSPRSAAIALCRQELREAFGL